MLPTSLFMNLVTNIFFWYAFLGNFLGTYLLTIVMKELLHRTPNRFFSIINGLAAVSFLLCAYLLPLTVQPRIIGSLGTPLTPPEQAMNPTVLLWGELPGLLLSYLGIAFLIV
ncbi:MAG: hypothetical protein ACFFCO_09530, partial [Promethearchaeota archaeon]